MVGPKRVKHHEILSKVNAWVDEGIAPLVDALNSHDDVITLDSCQGGVGSPAYVYFRFRGVPSDTPRKIHRLARSLGDNGAVGCSYNISVEYWSSSNPLGRIETDPSEVGRLAAAIRTRVLMAGGA